jgi:hypothetical protein
MRFAWLKTNSSVNWSLLDRLCYFVMSKKFVYCWLRSSTSACLEGSGYNESPWRWP